MTGSTIFGFQVADTYTELKKEGKEIVWSNLLKSEFTKFKEKASRVTRLDKLARGEIKKIAVSEVERALKIYYLDNKKYPLSIKELVGEYIEKDATIIQDKTFYYRKRGNGYVIGITLDNGDKHEIKKH